jgi:hypothetical protein
MTGFLLRSAASARPADKDPVDLYSTITMVVPAFDRHLRGETRETTLMTPGFRVTEETQLF